MHGSKLLLTLNIFSREEFYLLDNFLQSPYYFSTKRRREIYPLFQYILRYQGDWTHPNLHREKVYAALFPQQKVIKGKLEKRMSILLKEVHHFIAVHFSDQKEDTIQHTITLVEFFRHRNAHKFELHYLEKVKKQYAKIELKDKQYYFKGYMIGKEEMQRYLIMDQRFEASYLNAALQPLDIYYLVVKLDYACFLLSLDHFRKPIDIDHLILFLEQNKSLYEAQGLLKIPLIAIYYQAFEMLKSISEEEGLYWGLKKLIEENEDSIPAIPLRVLKGLMRAFIIFRYNHGATHFLDELFDLYKRHLELGYLNYENGILPSTFKNIVTVGLRTKAYDWVFYFLETYKNKIDVSANPEDVYHYNLAYYHFELKEYEKAEALLSDHYQDLFYKMAAKRLQLKIYYETKAEILDAKIDAFKVYIYRLPAKALLERKRASNNNFINFLRQLRNTKTRFNLKRINKLMTKIENSQFITEKDWLLAKLEALKI